MRPSLALANVALCISAMTSITAAYAPILQPVQATPTPELVARQDDADAETTEVAEKTSARDAKKTEAADDKDEKSSKEDDDEEATETGNKKTSTKKGSATRTKEEFDPTDQPGGIKMIEPDIMAGPAVYKVGNHVTWKWNYTSVLADPTNIDVIISCTAVSQAWTLTSNMSFATEGMYVWDSNEQAEDVSAPLLTEQYELIIKDSDDDIDAAPSPGYLAVATALTFGLYIPKSPIPLKDWKCDTCSNGISGTERQAIGMILGVCGVTIATFTWFVAGLPL